MTTCDRTLRKGGLILNAGPGWQGLGAFPTCWTQNEPAQSGINPLLIFPNGRVYARNMAVRFLKVFGLVLLYMALWAVVLLVPLLAFPDSDAVIVIVVLGSMVPIVGLFIPWLNFIVKKVFYFPGEGEPAPLAELLQYLQSINGYDAPVMVEEKMGYLVATWRYAEAKWWEVLAKSGMSKVYQLHMKFDERLKEVVLIDVLKSVDWSVGPADVRLRGGLFRGVAFEYETGVMWGIRENIAPGKVYAYRFDNTEIKYPIMNSIIRRGWGVRFGLW